MTLAKTSDIFQALADPTRLRLLNLLRRSEVCVCDLVEILGIPQPKISQHLAILRDVMLVTARKEGRWVHYSLSQPATLLHKKVLGCMTECFGDVELLADDLKRLDRSGCATGACCPPGEGGCNPCK